jgi:hypothetical protein
MRAYRPHDIKLNPEITYVHDLSLDDAPQTPNDSISTDDIWRVQLQLQQQSRSCPPMYCKNEFLNQYAS